MRLLLVLLALAAAPARGDEADEAQQLLDAGIVLFRNGRVSDARALFARAQERVPSRANPYRWLGLADARLGRCDEAIGELSRFLSMVKPEDPRAVDASAIKDRCERQPVVAPPPPPPVLPARPAVVTKRGWFIAVMSVTAGVVVAGVALGIAFGVPNDAAVPPTSLGNTVLGFR